MLSGGASLGAIQVGMLRALYERDITPDLIVGTSAGAFNGAYIASRPQTTPTAESLARIWRGLRRGQVFPVNPVTGLLGFLGARDHLVPESGLRRLISRYVECEELEEMRVPLHVIAVDVVTGQERRLSRGRVLDAILASAAVPGVLEPVAWEGRALIDGGVRRSRRSRRRSRRRRCGRAGSRSACRARSYAAGSPGARAAGCCSRR